MATISKAGIINGQSIEAQQILNIIEALDGTSSATILATGSLQGTSSFATTSSYVLGAPSGAFVGTTDTQTLTNKRVVSKILSTSSYAVNTGTSLNSNNYDGYVITGQTEDLLFNAPLGTPNDGQLMRISITSEPTSSSRTLTWNSSSGGFEASNNLSLPTSVSTRIDVGFIWNVQAIKWRIIAYA
jgi:hypothetical protein